MEKEFTRMINEYRGMIFKVCTIYSTDKESSKDLFQEIVLQLWKSFPSFKKESKESTWIYRVALNTAITNFRKEIKKPGFSPLDEDQFQIPDISSNEGELLDRLMNAINHLTGVEKAIALLYLEDKSYDEMASVLGMSNSNIGVRLHRIKNKLNELLSHS